MLAVTDVSPVTAVSYQEFRSTIRLERAPRERATSIGVHTVVVGDYIVVDFGREHSEPVWGDWPSNRPRDWDPVRTTAGRWCPVHTVPMDETGYETCGGPAPEAGQRSLYHRWLTVRQSSGQGHRDTHANS